MNQFINKIRAYSKNLLIAAGLSGMLVTANVGLLSLPAQALTPNNSAEQVASSHTCSGGRSCIDNRIKQITRLLSAGVGVVIGIMVVWGGVQYIIAGGNPQRIAAAKSQIGQALLALFLFIFGLGILNWLVPGTITGS